MFNKNRTSVLTWTRLFQKITEKNKHSHVSHPARHHSSKRALPHYSGHARANYTAQRHHWVEWILHQSLAGSSQAGELAGRPVGKLLKLYLETWRLKTEPPWLRRTCFKGWIVAQNQAQGKQYVILWEEIQPLLSSCEGKPLLFQCRLTVFDRSAS